MKNLMDVKLDPKLAERGVSVIFVLVEGALSPDAESILARSWQQAQVDFRATHSFPAVLNHPHLEAYRELHQALGIDDASLVPSPESLIRLLWGSKPLGSLGPVVDLYNAVALQHLVSIGAHDRNKLGQSVNLSMNNAEIKFRPIGQKKKLVLPDREYSYRTTDNRVICRLECKQANETKLRPETNSWFFILQGNKNIPQETLTVASESLIKTLHRHLGKLTYAKVMLDTTRLSGSLALPA